MNTLWLFEQPVDEAGKSTVTFRDIIELDKEFELHDNYFREGFPNPFPDLGKFNLKPNHTILVDASIYEEDGGFFCEILIWTHVKLNRLTIWNFKEKLPSEDAQWMLGIVSTLYSRGSDELQVFECHHAGQDYPDNSVVIDAIRKIKETRFIDPMTYSFIPFTADTDKYTTIGYWLLMFNVHEHHSSRDLVVPPIICKIVNNKLEGIDLPLWDTVLIDVQKLEDDCCAGEYIESAGVIINE